jgi:RNA polymerase sigma factor (TIGR02999 family)
MRDILVDIARRNAAVKRGGDRKRVDAAEVDIIADVPGDDILALNDALSKLEAEDARKAQIVMLKFFGGLSIPEIAEELGVSPSTIDREWRFTRAWLYRELDQQHDS